MMTPSDEKFYSGFGAIIGAPNAGKSTLLNRFLGEKISITSKKPQTTRNRILGVVHRPNAQIVFLDTPGIHKTNQVLNERIVDVALSTLGDVDLILMISDVSNPDQTSEQYLLETLRQQKKPVVLALNKIDILKAQESKIERIKSFWKNAFPFCSIIPISARHGFGIETLLNEMEKILPEGPPFFPEDTLTDLPERFIAAEIIREKIFRLTGQEIPYSAAVVVDSFKEKKNGRLVHIHATIHLERDSQKGIIIGKGGSRLKKIGEDARKDIERMLSTKVFLKLFVRVQKNWSKDTRAIRKFGY